MPTAFGGADLAEHLNSDYMKGFARIMTIGFFCLLWGEVFLYVTWGGGNYPFTIDDLKGISDTGPNSQNTSHQAFKRWTRLIYAGGV